MMVRELLSHVVREPRATVAVWIGRQETPVTEPILYRSPRGSLSSPLIGFVRPSAPKRPLRLVYLAEGRLRLDRLRRHSAVKTFFTFRLRRHLTPDTNSPHFF